MFAMQDACSPSGRRGATQSVMPGPSTTHRDKRHPYYLRVIVVPSSFPRHDMTCDGCTCVQWNGGLGDPRLVQGGEEYTSTIHVVDAFP